MQGPSVMLRWPSLFTFAAMARRPVPLVASGSGARHPVQLPPCTISASGVLVHFEL